MNTTALVQLPISAAVEVEFINGSGDSFGSGAGFNPQTPSERTRPLPIAPRRWLWLNADTDEVTRAVESGACVVDVDGKWTAFVCGGPTARRVLAAVVDVDTVLDSRNCASLWIFDCPAVLARVGHDRFMVCVQSSYVSSFEAAYAASLAGAVVVQADGGSNAAAGCATMAAAPSERADGGA